MGGAATIDAARKPQRMGILARPALSRSRLSRLALSAEPYRTGGRDAGSAAFGVSALTVPSSGRIVTVGNTSADGAGRPVMVSVVSG